MLLASTGDSSTTVIGWIFGISVVLALVAWVWLSLREDRREEARRAAILEHVRGVVPGFSSYAELSEKPLVFADRQNRLLVFAEAKRTESGDGFEKEHYTVSSRTRPTAEVQQVELKIDKEIVTRTSRGSLAGRALVGGALAGKGGAAVGAVTARTNSTERPTSFEVITLLSGGSPNVLKRTFGPKEEEKARTLLAQVTTLMRDEDKPDSGGQRAAAVPVPSPAPATLTSEPPPHPSSIGAELERLARLQESGAITSEEFQTLKARLLANPEA